MNTENFISLAKSCGFNVAEPLDVNTLEFLESVREACSADRCRNYGRSWACPPACKELGEMRRTVSPYTHGLLLQYVGDREDSFDFEAMEEAEANCKKAFYAMIDALKEQKADFMGMSAGTCTRCESCTYPDAPCRFPDRLYPSLEACGIFVSGLCKANGVPYYYGDGKIAFTCAVLWKE